MEQLSRRDKAIAIRDSLLKEVDKLRTDVVDLLYEIATDESVNVFAKEKANLLVVEYVNGIRGATELIEIINNIDSTIVYSGGHQFSSDNLSYVSPNSNISLQSGIPYTLNRIQTNWGQFITETIGHIIKTEESDYPITYGVLTISETNFHDYGSESSWSKYKALPRIDIVLE